MERLQAGVPAGSPLTAGEADDLFMAAHDHRNYLAAGALGPDLFFLLPDFKGDAGKGLLGLVEFVLSTWKFLDDTFIPQWEQWMGPVMDNNNQLANSITGGMLGEVSQVLGLLSGSLDQLRARRGRQMQDVFGLHVQRHPDGVRGQRVLLVGHVPLPEDLPVRAPAVRERSDGGRGLAHGGHERGRQAADEPSRVPKQQAFALGLDEPLRDRRRRPPVHECQVRRPVSDPLAAPPRHREPHGRARVRHAAPADDELRLARHGGAPFPARVPQEPHVARPDDARRRAEARLLPVLVRVPDRTPRARMRRLRAPQGAFDLDTEPLPEHICELLLKTMQDVYTGPADKQGRTSSRWDTGKHTGTGGRPTVAGAPAHVRARVRVLEVQLELRAGPAQPMPPPRHRRPRPAAAAGAPRRRDAELATPGRSRPRHPARDPRLRDLDRSSS